MTLTLVTMLSTRYERRASNLFVVKITFRSIKIGKEYEKERDMNISEKNVYEVQTKYILIVIDFLIIVIKFCVILIRIFDKFNYILCTSFLVESIRFSIYDFFRIR